MRILPCNAADLPHLTDVLQRHWQRIAGLDPRLPVFLDASPLLPLIEGMMTRQGVLSYYAEHLDHPVALIIAVPSVTPPLIARIVFMSADTQNAFKALSQLYSEVAPALFQAGYKIHATNVFAADPVLPELWNELGFGRNACYAAARFADLPGSNKSVSDLRIYRAQAKDAALIHNFCFMLREWHSRPPMFQPDQPAMWESLYANLDGELEDPEFGIFIAEMDGQPVGICDGYCLAERPVGLSTIAHSPNAYLRLGLVLPAMHGQGIGPAVCAAYYDWLRQTAKPQFVYLNFVTSNPAARHFWLSQGYKPIFYELWRVFAI